MRTTLVITAAITTVFAASAYIWYEENKRRSLLKTVFVEPISTPEIESPPEQIVSREDSQITMISDISSETGASAEKESSHEGSDHEGGGHEGSDHAGSGHEGSDLDHGENYTRIAATQTQSDDELSDEDNDQEEPEILIEYGPVLDLILYYFTLVMLLNYYVYVCLLN
jgi:hypothetical protein